MTKPTRRGANGPTGGAQVTPSAAPALATQRPAAVGVVRGPSSAATTVSMSAPIRPMCAIAVVVTTAAGRPLMGRLSAPTVSADLSATPVTPSVAVTAVLM